MAMTHRELIDKFNLIHNYEYNYSEVNFINRSTKISIICTTHGRFLQTPGNHLQGKKCRKCAKERASKARIMTLDEFQRKANIRHNNTFDYSMVEYVNSQTKVKILCERHGLFEQTPTCHIGGQGCPVCGKESMASKNRMPLEEFIKEANTVHNDTFDYSKVVYKNNSTKIIIGCPVHGEVLISPARHLQKYGCPKCGNEKKGGYLKSDYVTKANGRICTFYTLRCFNENEEFYKIGITVNNVAKRYSTAKLMPYNYEIISEIYGEAGFIWDLEKENMKKLNTFKYNPEIEFCGSKSECFTQYKLQ